MFRSGFLRFFALILVFTVLCCLCACGKKPTQTPAETTPAVTAEAAAEPTPEETAEATAEAVPEESTQQRYTDTVTSTEATAADYILNTSTMKFHHPDCGSVAQMNEENKQPFNGTREEAIARGYDPCGNCMP